METVLRIAGIITLGAVLIVALVVCRGANNIDKWERHDGK